MNIYGLLRFILQCLMSVGGGFIDKETMADALSLVNQLEKINALGTMGRITTGHHPFTIINHALYPPVCGICGKAGDDHE